MISTDLCITTYIMYVQSYRRQNGLALALRDLGHI